MKHNLDHCFAWLRTRKAVLPAILGVSLLASAVVALATPPLGFVVNEILAKGVVIKHIDQGVEIKRNADGTGSRWGLELETHGASDYWPQRPFRNITCVERVGAARAAFTQPPRALFKTFCVTRIAPETVPPGGKPR